MSDKLYCKNCAVWAFDRWKGWCVYGTSKWSLKRKKQYLSLPDIPVLENEKCIRCSSKSGFNLSDLRFVNYGPGLPNYFYIEFASNMSEKNALFHQKWQRPYLDGDFKERLPLDSLLDKPLINKIDLL